MTSTYPVQLLVCLIGLIIPACHGRVVEIYRASNRAQGLYVNTAYPRPMVELGTNTQVTRFRVRTCTGRVAGGVAFESQDNPGYYLRHWGYWLYLESISTGRNLVIFDKDSCFRIENRPGPSVRLQPINFPTWRVAVQSNQRLKISSRYATNDVNLILKTIEGIENYIKDGSDVRVNSRSSGSRGFRVLTSSGRPAALSTTRTTFKLRPCLNGATDGVAFESSQEPGFILRHYGFYLYLENNLQARNPIIFDIDACFLARESTGGSYRFEAINYPGYYIAVQANNRLKIDRVVANKETYFTIEEI